MAVWIFGVFLEEKDTFLLEVTSLRKDAVIEKSGWPNELTEGAAAFSMVTPQIMCRG